MKVLLIFLFIFPMSALCCNQLIYKNKPIDPLCFNIIELNGSVSLSDCGLKAHHAEIVGKNENLLKKGFIGFDYKEKLQGTAYLSHGYSYYEVFVDSAHHYFYVYTINNTGGSGVFTALYRVTRKRDRLNLIFLAGGDRCNKGIESVKREGQKIFYRIHITPYDFFSLNNHQKQDSNQHNQLQDCATCCVGYAIYQLDMSQGLAQPQLIAVRKNVDDLMLEGN